MRNDFFRQGLLSAATAILPLRLSRHGCSALVFLLSLVCLSGRAAAELQEGKQSSAPGSMSTAAESSASGSSDVWTRLSFLAGGSWIWSGDHGDSSINVAMRYQTAGPWVGELGAILPHNSALAQAAGPYGDSEFQDSTKSFSEIHLLGWREFDVVGGVAVPELGAGLSIARFEDQVIQVEPPFPTATFVEDHTNVGGMVLAGVTLSTPARRDSVGLNIDIGYAYFPNTVSTGSTNFNLRVDGLLVRALLQVKL